MENTSDCEEKESLKRSLDDETERNEQNSKKVRNEIFVREDSTDDARDYPESGQKFNNDESLNGDIVSSQYEEDELETKINSGTKLLSNDVNEEVEDSRGDKAKNSGINDKDYNVNAKADDCDVDDKPNDSIVDVKADDSDVDGKAGDSTMDANVDKADNSCIDTKGSDSYVDVKICDVDTRADDFDVDAKVDDSDISVNGDDCDVDAKTDDFNTNIKSNESVDSKADDSDVDAKAVDSDMDEADSSDVDVEDSDAGGEGVSSDVNDEAENSDYEDAEEKSDPYVKHFEFTLPDECTEEALSPKNPRLKYKLAEEFEMTGLGQMNFFKMFPHLETPPLNKKNVSEFALKKNLLSTVSQLKKQLTGLELSFLNIITNYIDVLFAKQYFKVREKLRRAYCIHILNHILKSKARIIHHNSKMKKNPEAEYRDQGFTQPTVFILAPFRGDCYRIVNQILSLLPPKCKIMNKNRFEQEYGPTGSKSKNKPEDFYEIFDGNNSEDFKIGLRIQNEHVTFFSDFYKSDLIIASPLGLRPIIGDSDNKKGDADFLSSIEVFIIDRLDVLMLQNPVHLSHVLLCLNHLVKKEHGNKKIDYFRVREYALDKKAKYYRQNIYLSSVENTSFVYNYYMSHCFNYVGHMRSHDWVTHPMIEFIYPAMQMCFRVLDSENPQQEFKDRRKFFTEKILPEFVNDKSTVQTLIYVPSYFDYVELRHHFRSSEISCFMMCEYTDKGKKAQGRDLFYKGHRHFMLYTERTHFYFRHWIKGIQHVIFYKLPTYPKFFREICNSLMDSHPKRKDEERTCTVIVTPRDFLQLKHIVGIQEADKMLKSKQKTFVKYMGS